MRIKKTSQYIEGGAGLPSYFTTETNTGMKWIDGKTIYRKVIDCGALPNNNTKMVNSGITDSINIINLYGVASNTANYVITIPFVHTTAVGTQCSLRFNGSTTGDNPNSIALITASDMTQYTKTYVIIEYTKN